MQKLLGITPDYTRGDRVLAWAVFWYALVFNFALMFVGVVIWNAFSPWPVEWWGTYFWIMALVVPGCVAVVMTFVIGIGGVIDLRRLFRDLNERLENDLDDGRVEGHVSLADKATFEKIEDTAEDTDQQAKRDG